MMTIRAGVPALEWNAIRRPLGLPSDDLQAGHSCGEPARRQAARGAPIAACAHYLRMPNAA